MANYTSYKQEMAARQKQQSKSGFSGVVRESFQGKEQATKVYVQGRQVLESRPTRTLSGETLTIGGQTQSRTTSMLSKGETATLNFPSQRVTITPTSIQSQTIQRQNVINEYEQLRRDNSLVLQAKTQELESARQNVPGFPGVSITARPQKLYADEPTIKYVQFGSAPFEGSTPIIQRGFPIDTAKEAESAKAKGGVIYGLESTKPQDVVQEIKVSSEYIQGYSSISSMGEFKRNIDLFKGAKASVKAYSRTEQSFKVDQGLVNLGVNVPERDYNKLFEQYRQEELKITTGSGGEEFWKLDKNVRLKLAVQDVFVGTQKFGLIATDLIRAYANKPIQRVDPLMGGFQKASLDIPGGLTFYGTQVLGLGIGATQSYSLYSKALTKGATKLQAANLAIGQTIEGFSPVQFKKSPIIISKKDTILQSNIFSDKSPLRTLNLGKVGDIRISTSAGKAQYVTRTKTEVFTFEPRQLVEFKSPSFLKTGSLTSLGKVQTFNFYGGGEVGLTIKNIGGIKKIDGDFYKAVVSGERRSSFLSNRLIAKSPYDLEVQKVFTTKLQPFKGTGVLRVYPGQDGAVRLGLSKTQLKVYTKESITQVFNAEGKLISTDFLGPRFNPKGYKLSGRPSIIRGIEAYTEIKPLTGKPYGYVNFGKYTLRLGRSIALGKSGGKSITLGFKTEIYSPKKDLFSIDKANIKYVGSDFKIPYNKGRSLGDMGALGGYDRKTDTIYISKNLGKVQAKDIIKHELGHRFAYQTGAEKFYTYKNLKYDVLKGNIKSDLPAKLKLAGYPNTEIAKEYLAEGVFKGLQLKTKVLPPSTSIKNIFKISTTNIGLSYPKQSPLRIKSSYSIKSLVAPLFTSKSSLTSISSLGLSQQTLSKQIGLSRVSQTQSTSLLQGLSLRQATTTSYIYGTSFIPQITPPITPNFGSPILTPPNIIIPGFPTIPSLGGDLIMKPKKKGRKGPRVRIAPSFTSLQLGIKIKSPVKESKTFGISPFQTRGIYKGKGPYSKLVDF